MNSSAPLLPPTPISLVVGLGNPGSKYEGTRHNIGFEVVDRLAQRWLIPLKVDRRFQAEYGVGSGDAGQRLHLIKPQTYMNRSGQSLRATLDWFKLSPASLLVIYDDMDLPVGRLRLRLSGSAGGHNGMKSIIDHLKTQEFSRLRIGIGAGRQPADRDRAVISHVLGNFSKAERQIMDGVVDRALEAVEICISAGVERAMNLYNALDLQP
jgi:PTH1 family peptidyl-tRNA hydrolase